MRPYRTVYLLNFSERESCRIFIDGTGSELIAVYERPLVARKKLLYSRVLMRFRLISHYLQSKQIFYFKWNSNQFSMCFFWFYKKSELEKVCHCFKLQLLSYLLRLDTNVGEGAGAAFLYYSGYSGSFRSAILTILNRFESYNWSTKMSWMIFIKSPRRYSWRSPKNICELFMKMLYSVIFVYCKLTHGRVTSSVWSSSYLCTVGWHVAEVPGSDELHRLHHLISRLHIHVM
jgi:hypothetical protein